MSEHSDDKGTGPAGEVSGEDEQVKEAAPPEAERPADLPADPVADLEKRNAELQDRLLRLAAEFDNWKKRARKEQEEAAARGREPLLKEILSVVDNLERALQHAAPDDPLATGVQLVEKQLLAVLEKFGVTRFDPAGHAFDPMLHEAISQVETLSHPAGSISQVFSRGYMHQGRLLRPAMVQVAKAPERPLATNGSGAPLDNDNDPTKPDEER